MSGWTCFPSLTRGLATSGGLGYPPPPPVLRKIFKIKELGPDLGFVSSSFHWSGDLPVVAEFLGWLGAKGKAQPGFPVAPGLFWGRVRR
jgi:hypothetical protein